MRSTLRKALLALLCAAPLASLPASAQSDAGDWKHTFVLYGMGAAIEGTAGLRDFEVPVDLSISDVFDALEMGTMAAYRGENDAWSVTVDATFMGLGATSRSQGGASRGTSTSTRPP